MPIFMAMVSVILLAFAPVIISFFTKEPAVADFAILAVRIVSAGYIFYGIGMVMANAFNGAGDTRTPTIINFFGFWFFQIPLAWCFQRPWAMGPVGVFIAIPLQRRLLVLLAYILFKKGKMEIKKSMI
jgi:Na+-driven multidrug efflux pump